MQIIGTGTHIVECSRIRRMIEQHGERFLLRVYTPAELAFCQERRRTTEAFAEIWAAKEAIFQAMQIRRPALSWWSQVEIVSPLHQPLQAMIAGQVASLMTEKAIDRFDLAVSSCRHFAVAYVIAEGTSRR